MCEATLRFRRHRTLLLLLVLAACHDAPRDNALDPALTPAVELDIRSQGLPFESQVVTLQWTAYHGRQPFAAYRVLRRAGRTDAADTLATILARGQTSFTDSLTYPELDYHYQVAVANTGGFEARSREHPNPGYAAEFDPEFTPRPELELALDELAGVVSLAWTSYQGQQPFAAYWVLRHVVGRSHVDTLSRIPHVGQTSLVDTTAAPNTPYGYRVSVVNTGGFEVSSEPETMAGYGAGPVAVVAAEVDPAHGEVRLRWSRYRGARFSAYRVERRAAGEADFVVVERAEAPGDTVFADIGLEPDTAYFYRIVVEAAGQSFGTAPEGPVQYGVTAGRLLSARVDARTGTALLVWSRYLGPDFEAYRILRRGAGAGVPEELRRTVVRSDTTFLDETLRAEVDYEYTVGVAAFGRELATDGLGARLSLAPVEIESLDFHSPTASAALAWTPYAGPRFRAYRVVRRTGAAAPRVVGEISDPADTSYRDAGLDGNTDHVYRIVVVTAWDEEVASAEQSGLLHPLLASWPLAAEAGEYARLYLEEESRLAVLLSSPERIRMLSFDLNGSELDERILLQHPLLQLVPTSAATALMPDGRRFLSMAAVDPPVGTPSGTRSHTSWIARLGADGALLGREIPLFADVAPPVAPAARNQVGFDASSAEAARSGWVAFDYVRASTDGKTLFADDFGGAGPAAWDEIDPELTPQAGWVRWQGQGGGRKSLEDGSEARPDLRLEARVAGYRDYAGWLDPARRGFGPSLQIESVQESGSSLFKLALDYHTQRAWLWLFLPPPASLGLFEESVQLVDGVAYGLGVEVAGEDFRAWVRVPFWVGATAAGSEWTALVLVADRLVVAEGGRAHSIDPAGEPGVAEPLAVSGDASEIRRWEAVEPGQEWVGVCLPLANQVLAREADAGFAARPAWPAGQTLELSSGAGQGAGQFIFPLSFDAASDGRLYVLDAGNARIQVFDAGGDYVTQWGRRGSGEGEFDFGGGGLPEDFAGSVAVDPEGNIYVADLVNRRIQKFAP